MWSDQTLLSQQGEHYDVIVKEQKETWYLFDQTGHIESCEGRLLRDLHHHSVAGGEGRAQLPGLH